MAFLDRVMMLKCKAQFVLTTVGLSLGCLGILSSSAQALELTYSHPIAPRNITFTENFTLPKFDPSLGSLNSLQIISDFTIAPVASVFNATNTSQPFTQATVSIPFTVNTPSGAITTSVISNPVDGIAAAGPFVISYFPSSSVTQTLTTSINPTNFGLYQGSGGQSASFSFVTSEGTYGGIAGTGVSFSGDAVASGNVSIHYSYDPVPEPMTILGTVAAIAFMGRLNRRFFE